jgi:hypothetical protein
MIHQPINKEIQTDNIYPLEEIRDFLQGYLDNDFELTTVLTKPKKRKKRKKRKKSKAAPAALPDKILENKDPADSETLILAVRVIAARVVLKYCKGVKPHWHRYAIWKKGIRILDYFESQGLLKAHDSRYCHIDGYIFLCRDYSVTEHDTFTLPVHKPRHVSDWPPSEEPGLQYCEMPTIVDINTKREKKAAAMLIADYVLQSAAQITQPEAHELQSEAHELQSEDVEL